MREASVTLEFEEAARLHSELKRLQATELAIGADPRAKWSGKAAATAAQGATRHTESARQRPSHKVARRRSLEF